MALKQFNAQGIVFSYMGRHYGPGICNVRPETHAALSKKLRQLNGEETESPEELGEREELGNDLPDPRVTREAALKKMNLSQLRDMAVRYELDVKQSSRKEPYIAAILDAEFGKPDSPLSSQEEEASPDFTSQVLTGDEDEEDDDTEEDEEEEDEDK
jgi:hypothetical protein